MPSEPEDAVSVDVGNRLRELREARQVTTPVLARKSGLSANALSMIERGKSSPSVSTLYKLAEVLGVPVTDFFSPAAVRQTVVFLKADGRTRLPFFRGLWEDLGGEQFTGRVMPFMITLENGASSGRTNNMVHSGHEFVYCVRGRLEYVVEGQTYLLETGDSLLFQAHLKHRWRNPGGTVTNGLIVITDYVEDEHPASLHAEAARD